MLNKKAIKINDQITTDFIDDLLDRVDRMVNKEPMDSKAYN